MFLFLDTMVLSMNLVVHEHRNLVVYDHMNLVINTDQIMARMIVLSGGFFLVLVILVKIKYKSILVQSWFKLCSNVINLWEEHFGYGRCISIWDCISVMGRAFQL